MLHKESFPAEFGVRLRTAREARRWSQERLAAEAEVDHSLVSRLERGQRRATRESVDALALGLGLTAAQQDGLLLAAGFAPHDPVATIQDEPEVAALYRALRDDRGSDLARAQLRLLLRSLVLVLGLGSGEGR